MLLYSLVFWPHFVLIIDFFPPGSKLFQLTARNGESFPPPGSNGSHEITEHELKAAAMAVEVVNTKGEIIEMSLLCLFW
jgi:hypothetical protein